MSKKIVITGATGLIGENLCKALINRGDELHIFTRSVEKGKYEIPGAAGYIQWDYHEPESFQEALKEKDAVIHLAGANLFAKRWDEEYKNILIESRQISTRNLVNAIGNLEEKPNVFICASGISFYGDKGDELLTEDKNPGDAFLSKLCVIWENEAAAVEKFDVRRVSIRTGIVMSPEEGALKEFLTPFKLFVGGPLGTGRQYFSWVHIKDIIGIYLFVLDNENINGPVNSSSPNPIRMDEFANTLGKVLKRPSIFKVPEFAIKIVTGEVAVAVTASLKVVPKKLLENGYDFKFKNLDEALRDLLNKR